MQAIGKTRSRLTHLLTLLLLAAPASAVASIDQLINDAVAPITFIVSSIIFFSVPVAGAEVPLVVVWLVVAAIFFTGYFNFLNFSGFKHAIDIVRGLNHNPKAPGEVSHFQALTTAVSGTVGIGNIGGVAVAISLGGPGATFWLIVAGLLGMSTKFIECTLGTIYRRHNPDGSVSAEEAPYFGPAFF